MGIDNDALLAKGQTTNAIPVYTTALPCHVKDTDRALGSALAIDGGTDEAMTLF
jgi:hypothetical protein